MSKNSVVVGNIGTVLHDGTWREAKAVFLRYRKQSRTGKGRAGGESVTWLKDGDIYLEYTGRLHKEDS